MTCHLDCMPACASFKACSSAAGKHKVILHHVLIFTMLADIYDSNYIHNYIQTALAQPQDHEVATSATEQTAHVSTCWLLYVCHPLDRCTPVGYLDTRSITRICTGNNAADSYNLTYKLNQHRMCGWYWLGKPVWPSRPFAAVQQSAQLQTLPRMHDVDVWP